MRPTLTETNLRYLVYHPRSKKFLCWSFSTVYHLTTLSEALRLQSFRTRAEANDFIELVTDRHKGAQTHLYEPKADKLLRVFLKDENFRVLKVKQVVIAKT